MKGVNTEFGFYGAIKSRFDEQEQIENIWFTVFQRIRQICPELTNKKIKDLLNSKIGRHFADELLDMPGDITMATVLMRIAMLNKLSMRKWLVYQGGYALVMEPVDNRMLFKSAIKHEMRKKSIRNLMIDMIGCKDDAIWPDPETWINADNIPTSELKSMWQYIQREIKTKGKK